MSLSKTVTVGSLWYDNQNKTFKVLRVWHQADSDLWVAYTNAMGQEFSCRAEAFVSRFSLSLAT